MGSHVKETDWPAWGQYNGLGDSVLFTCTVAHHELLGAIDPLFPPRTTVIKSQKTF